VPVSTATVKHTTPGMHSEPVDAIFHKDAGNPSSDRGKPRILIVADYFVPGVRAGGPIRSIQNLVDALRDEFEFAIVTRDRDLGLPHRYDGVIVDEWQIYGGTPVYYVAGARLRPWKFIALVRAWKPDIIYLNSFFSPWYSIMPHLILRLFLRRAKVLIAPRGEFFPGALALKRVRKKLFLRVVRATGIYDGTMFHASTEEERRAIRSQLKPRRVLVSPVLIAPDLVRVGSGRTRTVAKEVGQARLIVLSRIARNKNILAAIDMLRDAVGLIELHIYGPIHDAAYWAECLAACDNLPDNVTVEYVGVLPSTQVAQTLEAYHFFVSPTHGENFGHAIAEALCSGCPVLISDKTPWSDVQAAGAGFVCTLDKELGHFRAALRTIVALNETGLDRMREAAFQFAKNRIERAEAAQENRQLFRRLLSLGSKDISHSGSPAMQHEGSVEQASQNEGPASRCDFGRPTSK
jgi:glycosyltransferase involved in cell wall biosynthesis